MEQPSSTALSLNNEEVCHLRDLGLLVPVLFLNALTLVFPRLQKPLQKIGIPNMARLIRAKTTKFYMYQQS